jgi:hypothetical protein
MVNGRDKTFQRRGSVLLRHPAEVEPSLVNRAKLFDAGNCDRCGPEPICWLRSASWRPSATSTI